MRLYVGLLTSVWLLGCASGPRVPEESANYGYRDGRVWVRGPWDAITSSRDVDEVVDQLCPAVKQLPNAQLAHYGQEYCGAIYSLGDGTYYASYASPLADPALAYPEKDKNCKTVRYVDDARGRPSILADFHSHPYKSSSLSPQDKQARWQRWSIRIQFDTSCRILKLVPNLDSDRPGEIYERQDKKWLLIGIIKPEDKADGFMTPVKRQANTEASK